MSARSKVLDPRALRTAPSVSRAASPSAADMVPSRGTTTSTTGPLGREPSSLFRFPKVRPILFVRTDRTPRPLGLVLREAQTAIGNEVALTRLRPPSLDS